MNIQPIRIGFFGTPALSATVLQNLLDDPRFTVLVAITNPDKPIGRDQILSGTPVKKLAELHHIEVLTPQKIRGNEQLLDHIRSFECDYFVVVAYGKILPKELLEIPKKICINIHGSILPKYRGASPIQSALLHGETETGVTIMQMSEGMDEGDILSIQKIAIDANETSGSLFEKFAEISGRVLIDTIMNYEGGVLQPTPQGHWIPVYAGMTEAPEPSYCKKIEKEDGLIDWSLSAREIYWKWQAYTPWPGIYTMYEGKRFLLEITNYELGITNIGEVGKVIKLEDGWIGVVCGQGILTLEQVKLEGKKSQNIKDFVNGNQEFIGYNFL